MNLTENVESLLNDAELTTEYISDIFGHIERGHLDYQEETEDMEKLAEMMSKEQKEALLKALNLDNLKDSWDDDGWYPNEAKFLRKTFGVKEEPKTLHLRLVGMNQKIGEVPTELHISIEEGGTLTDLKGKGLWNGFISVESFEETMNTYLQAKESKGKLTGKIAADYADSAE